MAVLIILITAILIIIQGPSRMVLMLSSPSDCWQWLLIGCGRRHFNDSKQAAPEGMFCICAGLSSSTAGQPSAHPAELLIYMSIPGNASFSHLCQIQLTGFSGRMSLTQKPPFPGPPGRPTFPNADKGDPMGNHVPHLLLLV